MNVRQIEIRAAALATLAVVSLFPALARPAAAQDLQPDRRPGRVDALPRPTLAALPVDGTIRLDGVLDEATWSAPPATGFIQAEPSEGAPVSERTEVWVAQGGGNLYIAARLYDAEPDRLVINDIRKDFDEFTQDVFEVILDTFHDRRNGYVFMTNPAGARGDRQIVGEGRDINASWDAIWRVETSRDEEGWTVEMEIPFRAIRSARGPDGAWGINFSRRIRRKNEVAFWAPIPRAYALTRLSMAGTLTGLPTERVGGRDLRVKPFVLGNTVRATGGAGFDEDVQGGVDVKWGVTRGLALDVTVNPDFAQVEADEQRVNLTQFSLFFPEKREFFLENQGLFYVGDLARNTRTNRTPRLDEDLLPFFSRRIGLTEDGRTAPIRGGARLTGNAGGFQIGAMGMRTGDVEGVPGSDWGVFRARRNLFSSSDVGAIFMTRRARERGSDDFNRVYGADAYVRLPGDVDWSVYYLKSDTRRPLPEEDLALDDGSELNGYAFRTSLNREGNFLHVKGGFMQMGPEFRDDLGFFRRTGFRKYFIDTGIRPRSEWLRGMGVRELHPHIVWNYFDDLDGRMLAKWFHSGLTAFMSDGGFTELSVNEKFERIDDPFTIDSGTDPIPAGSYGWTEWQLLASTDASRTLSFSFTGILGGLWSGTQRTVRLGVNVKPSYAFRASVGLDRTDADLDEPDAEFVQTLWTGRANYSFNRNMFVDALIQYDASRDLINSNVRFNLIHAPLSDVFVVWNEQRVTTGDGTPPGRSFTVKVTRMLAF